MFFQMEYFAYACNEKMLKKLSACPFKSFLYTRQRFVFIFFLINLREFASLLEIICFSSHSQCFLYSLFALQYFSFILSFFLSILSLSLKFLNFSLTFSLSLDFFLTLSILLTLHKINAIQRHQGQNKMIDITMNQDLEKNYF